MCAPTKNARFTSVMPVRQCQPPDINVRRSRLSIINEVGRRISQGELRPTPRTVPEADVSDLASCRSLAAVAAATIQ